jgi:hypothetical protein
MSDLLGYVVTFRNATGHGVERRTFDALQDAEHAARTVRPWNNTDATIRPVEAPAPREVVDGVTIVGPSAFGTYQLNVDDVAVVTVQRRGDQWHTYLTRSLGSGRFYSDHTDAMTGARRMAAGFTRCSLPVACRLCRLPKRHDGPCVPWA